MKDTLYSDNYQVIRDMGNGQAIWATIYLDAQTMPLPWAYKVISYFKAGNDKAAYRLIDLVNIRIEKIRRNKA